MSISPIVITDPAGSRDNEVRPFAIEGMDVRGRSVRLGTVVDQVLRVHDYPDAVARILGELSALAVLLGSIIKSEGVVTVQTKSNGPVPMMVADYEVKGEGPGRLRAYASVDEQLLAQYGKNPSFHGLIGSKAGGYLALTIDQGENTERYQGIVALSGHSLSEVAMEYFRTSEQTPTHMKLVCERDTVTGNWRAGGIMIQHLARGEVDNIRLTVRAEDQGDHWNRAQILMESVSEAELLDPSLDLDQLLLRLYHEDGVRVFTPSHTEFGCRCSRERILSVIAGFPQEDIDHMTVDGQITVDCHFCGSQHVFDPAKIA